MVTGLRKLWGAGLAAGIFCSASGSLHAEDTLPPAPAAAPAGPSVPASLRSKESKEQPAVGHSRVGCNNCGTATCKSKTKCSSCGTSCDSGCCPNCGLASIENGLHQAHDWLKADLARKTDPEYLHRRYGYFIPQGSCGGGTPRMGHYHMGYAVNPYHFDPRDASVFAAQGYGVPMAVPLPPMVEHQYNYSWGVPSSRLTGLYRYQQEPGILPPPSAVPPRSLFPVAFGTYSNQYSADQFAPPAGPRPGGPLAPPARPLPPRDLPQQ